MEKACEVCSPIPSCAARSIRSLSSATHTRSKSAGCACRRAPIITHRSGPMPAGSPAVSTSRGRARMRRSDVGIDEGLVAQPAQPQLGFLVGLAFAQLPESALAQRFLGGIELAASQQLHDVPAELRAEG